MNVRPVVKKESKQKRKICLQNSSTPEKPKKKKKSVKTESNSFFEEIETKPRKTFFNEDQLTTLEVNLKKPMDEYMLRIRQLYDEKRDQACLQMRNFMVDEAMRTLYATNQQGISNVNDVLNRVKSQVFAAGHRDYLTQATHNQASLQAAYDASKMLTQNIKRSSTPPLT